MQRIFASILLAAVLFVATTFAGMAFFGMDAEMMGMNPSMCTGMSCATSHNMDTHGVDCVGHCISAVTPAAATPVSIAISFILLVIAIAFFFTPAISNSSEPLFQRWREGIGKLLLHQKLCTVILRD